MAKAKSLPARPNLTYLKKLAKEHLAALRRRDPTGKLADSQLALAREYGFASWRAMKAHINSLPAAAAPPKELQYPRRTSDWKPIMDAAFAGDAPRVRRLLDGGADPNARGTTGHHYRPLHRAIEHKKTMPKHQGHDAVVKLLLERGADPRIRATYARMTALELAATNEPRFVQRLRSHFEPLDVFHASVAADEQRVAQLLKKDPSRASACDESGYTPLHLCAASLLFRLDARHDRALGRVAEMLLGAGADPNAARMWNDEWPLRPLYFACGHSNNPRVAEILIRAGADPCDDESVYHASDEGHIECLEVIARLTDPARLAKECTKCLAVQLQWGRTRGMKWLLEHGADPNWKHPKSGRTAIEEAARQRKTETVIRMLRGYADKRRG